MFEQSLVESTAALRSTNRWPVVISTAFYTAMALALVTLPVLHPDVLSVVAHPLLTFTPPRPYTPPPPPPPVHLQPTLANSSSAAPAPIAPIINRADLPPTTAPTEVPNFNNTTISMNSGNPTTVIGSSIPTGPTVTRAPGSTGTGGNGTAPRGPLAISSGVSAGMLLAPIQPIYPPIAKAAHQQGVVTVQAIISRTGQIESARVVSGPAMLQASALEAIRAARYRPYLLNGQPTEVDTTFSINFRLGSD